MRISPSTPTAMTQAETRTMNALYGPPTVLEEIEEELGTELPDLSRRAAE